MINEPYGSTRSIIETAVITNKVKSPPCEREGTTWDSPLEKTIFAISLLGFYTAFFWAAWVLSGL